MDSTGARGVVLAIYSRFKLSGTAYGGTSGGNDLHAIIETQDGVFVDLPLDSLKRDDEYAKIRDGYKGAAVD